MQLLGNGRAAADIDAEAADGPQQEFYHPLYIAVVRLGHFRSSVDKGSADGDLPFVSFNGDCQGLCCALQIGIHPHAKGNKAGIQLGNGPQIIGNT